MLEWLLKYPLEVYRTGHIGLRHAPRLELVVLIVAAVAVWAWWSYGRQSASRGGAGRALLATVRTISTLLVLLCLAGPVLRTRKQEDSQTIVAAAIDVSRSMGLPAADGAASRLERAQGALHLLTEKLTRAGIDVRIYAIGASARPTTAEQLARMSAADDSTHLAAALREIVQAARGAALDAIVLLSDGVETGSADPVATARYAASRGIAVHAVGFGRAQMDNDVEIVEVHCPRQAERGTAVELHAAIRRGGITAPLELRLFHDALLLRSEPVPPADGDRPVTVRMTFIPERDGPADLTLEVPPAPGETIVENNRRSIHIDVRETRVEVLLVEGSPRHEYAFIRRAMHDNRHFKVVTLLRLGKGQYYHRGDDDSILSEGFPDSAEKLARFKAVILSDIEASFFTEQQLALLADFVRVRGGGLLMLGGVNSFNLGGYGRTVLADLLPVYLTESDVAASFDDSEYSLVATPEGSAHEILRLLPDPAENAAQWALMPPLRGLNPLYRAKPGAMVLATASTPDGAGRRPILLAVQDVGAGRTAAFAPANSWRWKMLRRHDDDAFKRFWGQMIRWLAAGAREMLVVNLDSNIASPHNPLKIMASVSDRRQRPFNDAKVSAVITDPFGRELPPFPIPWSLREDGLYEETFVPDQPGQYGVKVQAVTPNGRLEAQSSFYVAESSDEFLRPTMDAECLRRIAAAGGGTVELNGMVNAAAEAILAAARAKRTLLDVIEERELRDAPALLLGIVALWLTEWVVRRRRGLA